MSYKSDLLIKYSYFYMITLLAPNSLERGTVGKKPASFYLVYDFTFLIWSFPLSFERVFWRIKHFLTHLKASLLLLKNRCDMSKQSNKQTPVIYRIVSRLRSLVVMTNLMCKFKTLIRVSALQKSWLSGLLLQKKVLPFLPLFALCDPASSLLLALIFTWL